MKKKLKDICTQVRGVSYKPSDLRDENSGLPILRANNIQDTGIVLDELVYVDSSKVHSEQYLLTDDIVICASSGSKNLVGKAATFKSDLSASFGAFCKVVRINNSDDLCKAYIQQYFQSKIYRNAISESSAGANINNIKTEDIEALEIPLPSKEEQIKIAAELDTIQSAIDNKKQQLALLDEAVKSEFVEMFGENPVESGKWSIMKLNSISDVRDGTHDSPSYYSEGYPFITTKNLIDGTIDFSTASLICKKDYEHFDKRSHVDDGDILMPMIGTIGGAILVKKERDFAIKNVALIKPNADNSNLNFNFLLYVLNSDFMFNYFNQFKTGGTQKFISLSFIRELPIPIPPLDLQNQFAAFVQQIDKSKFVLQQQLQFIKKYVIMTSWRKICFYTTVAM